MQLIYLEGYGFPEVIHLNTYSTSEFIMKPPRSCYKPKQTETFSFS